ncbi:MAG: 3-oxoacyl-[acyl-carrier-protein] synthase [Frankiaceae bacterium]|nr:3-oxoacyl-[acyl-carrier-protein] synthase [Frankiaceae bacterium]
MQPIVVNRHGRLVFPSNFIPELDLSVMNSLEQLDGAIRRDFEVKAPTGTDIAARVDAGEYTGRYELLRDLALNLFWTNRFALTLYEKRPTRWADVSRTRREVYLPILTPWVDGDRKIAAVQRAYDSLPPTWDEAVEERIFGVLFDVFGHRKHHAGELPAIKPTVAEILSDPTNLTFRLNSYDADFPIYGFTEIADCAEEVAELEALNRWAMVLHNQYPWDRSQAELVEVGQLQDDDYVVVFHPRNEEVRHFLRRLDADSLSKPVAQALPVAEGRAATAPIRPYPPVNVRTQFAVLPRIEALAVVHGDLVCTNEDLVRNAAYNWSPMAADEIREKTGIEQRRYTSRTLEEIALQAAQAALAHAGRGPAEIGAVLVCTCTSNRLIPSVASWISGQLGIYQTHASYDIIAACAGMAYGVSDATRILQEVQRPVLVVCVEKFSDKIGNVRPSRMIFGDGAAAILIGVAPPGEPPDIDYLQTYASGPASQVNSIIWPNPDFDNNITVYGPEVKSLAGRYLVQMIDELKALPDPDGVASSLLDSIGLIVPHQANKTMVTTLALKAGLSADSLYFNIEQVGNASAASIPLAIHDAVRDGVIKEPTRIFAPGFGAGAVAGYCVLRIDPAVVAIDTAAPAATSSSRSAGERAPSERSSDDVQLAFG